MQNTNTLRTINSMCLLLTQQIADAESEIASNLRAMRDNLDSTDRIFAAGYGYTELSASRMENHNKLVARYKMLKSQLQDLTHLHTVAEQEQLQATPAQPSEYELAAAALAHCNNPTDCSRAGGR